MFIISRNDQVRRNNQLYIDVRVELKKPCNLHASISLQSRRNKFLLKSSCIVIMIKFQVWSCWQYKNDVSTLCRLLVRNTLAATTTLITKIELFRIKVEAVEGFIKCRHDNLVTLTANVRLYTHIKMKKIPTLSQHLQGSWWWCSQWREGYAGYLSHCYGI